MSSAAPTSAECVCTRGGRSAGAVGNHCDAAGSGYSSVEWMESMESSRATPAQGYGCGSASAFNAAFVGFIGGGGVCSMLS